MRLYLDPNSDFRCLHCRNFVSAEVMLAGVNNRNHCPYCLWSRHMDLFKAGDRLAACKSAMRPVGLTFKHRRKKYASAANGELMIVHQCVECESLSINRVAADDFADIILEVFWASMAVDDHTREQMQLSGITLLGANSQDRIYRQLYGQAVPA
jgi:hypothetical protein